MTIYKEISKSFNQCAMSYELAAKAQLEIGRRLFERLDYLNIAPQRILDLGCGPGQFSLELARIYPKAHVIGLDFAQRMLIQARGKQSWRRKWSLMNADMLKMPFCDGAFDLIFANQVIHWAHSLPALMRELNRVMSAKGCLMFTTLGPDTFREIKIAWQNINAFSHVNVFADMHDVGDCLMAEHFLDPVIDMEYLTVHYESLPALITALRTQGVKHINVERNKGLTGKASWKQFENNYDAIRTEHHKYPLTYEVIYGHAWKGEQRKTEKGIETMIPLSQIRRSL